MCDHFLHGKNKASELAVAQWLYLAVPGWLGHFFGDFCGCTWLAETPFGALLWLYMAGTLFGTLLGLYLAEGDIF